MRAALPDGGNRSRQLRSGRQEGQHLIGDVDEDRALFPVRRAAGRPIEFLGKTRASGTSRRSSMSVGIAAEDQRRWPPAEGDRPGRAQPAGQPRRFNDSWLYRAYVGIANPVYARELRTEEAFIASAGPLRPILVFDLGRTAEQTRIFRWAGRPESWPLKPAGRGGPAYGRFLRNRKSPSSAGRRLRGGDSPAPVFAGADCISTFSAKWGAPGSMPPGRYGGRALDHVDR